MAASASSEQLLQLVVHEAEVVHRFLDVQARDVEVLVRWREEDGQGHLKGVDREVMVLDVLGDVVFLEVARVLLGPVRGRGDLQGEVRGRGVDACECCVGRGCCGGDGSVDG